MASFFLYQYQDITNYQFEKLPKGQMFSFCMNPYNGKVFASIEKHASSTLFALDIMREIVSACDSLERGGSVDPLRDLLSATDSGADISAITAPVETRVIEFKKEEKHGAEACMDVAI